MATTNKKISRKRIVNPESQEKPAGRSLYRPREGRVLGGVCVGLAKFIDYDPVVIRLLFVFVTLFGGSGVLVYLILWLIIPTEGQPAEITAENVRNSAEEIKIRAQNIAAEAKLYSKKNNSRQTVGIILIILGAFFLLQNFTLFRFDFLFKFWPVLLIILAIYIIGKND